MKRLSFAAALIIAAMPAFAADVGVSVSIGDPDFYGRLDIGDYAQPRVIYRRPVVVERGEVSGPPVYLRVPRGHSRNWHRYCNRYDACGERVYFVQNSWYNREYAPRYRQRHGDGRDGRHDEHRGDQGRDHWSDRRGEDHDRNR